MNTKYFGRKINENHKMHNSIQSWQLEYCIKSGTDGLDATHSRNLKITHRVVTDFAEIISA